MLSDLAAMFLKDDPFGLDEADDSGLGLGDGPARFHGCSLLRVRPPATLLFCPPPVSLDACSTLTSLAGLSDFSSHLASPSRFDSSMDGLSKGSPGARVLCMRAPARTHSCVDQCSAHICHACVLTFGVDCTRDRPRRRSRESGWRPRISRKRCAVA
jgi:hypothetical protein